MSDEDQFYKTLEEYNKQLERVNLSIKESERVLASMQESAGIRTITYYQCIYCGEMFNDIELILTHNTERVCRQDGKDKI